MRPLILPRYILREHLGPFCFSFAMMTLLFLLDLAFRHWSRILSKDLPPAIGMEFFGLNLAWIVATVALMAVFTATQMAFGRLAGGNEITVRQAGAAGLFRQALPVFIAAAALAADLIWFNNSQPESWCANFLAGGFGFSFFRRIATGKFAPRALRVESWFSRFSFRNLFGIFRRRRKNHDEALYRLTRYEPVEMETRKLVWGSEGEDNNFEGEDNNNDAAVLPTMRPNESQPAAYQAMPKSAAPVSSSSSSPLAFTPVAEILNQFTNRIRANLVLLADRNGIPLAHDKMPHVKLPLPADLEMMAKLAAGQIATTREIARTVEDDGRIDSILQEGASWNSFIYPINDDYNLIAIVEKSVVIGLVRLQANEVVPSLRKVLEMI
jgi:predicted regulator of Ras-like GTPase activity (Roadblock/LC7/MglB family)